MEQLPVSIRVLPMTSNIADEFDNCTSVQDVQENFFLLDLPSRSDCSYLHRRNGLDARSGTIVLFQCQGQIIASATFLGSERFGLPTADGYTGQLFFDPRSIRTFKPINAEGIRNIWPTFKRFGQSPLHLTPEGYPVFLNQLENVKLPSALPPVFPTDSATTSSRSSGVSDHWTDAEYKATVEAYLWMLEQETAGKPYNKSEVNNQLRFGALSARSKASIEYRMQNISAVFQELCLPWIKGYKPAVNVGTEGKEIIKRYAAIYGGYNPADYLPTADSIELEQKVRKVRKKIVTVGIPAGEINPQQTSVTSKAYVRDPLVKAWVLENAKGVCEACGSPAPFQTIYDEPFLEVHHVTILAKDGGDTITNAIAVCPNCHRRFHQSKDRDHFTESMYSKISRLVSE